WSPDGARVAATSEEGSVRLWLDPGPAGRALSLADEGQLARSPVFSADGAYLTAIVGGRARVWTRDGAPLSGPFGPPGARVLSAVPGPDGRYFLLQSAKRRAEVWTVDAAVPCQAKEVSERPCLVATLDEQSLAAGWSPDGWSVFAAHFNATD